MFNEIKKSIQWGGRTLTLETGKIARQADGAVLVSYGNTKVLATVVGDKKAKDGVDFFPLTCIYQEKAFAAGRIPGGYVKREGKPSQKEVLTSRLIDRPIRPLFEEGFYNETQIICTVLQYDAKNDPDVIALIGASAALSISGLPFVAPIAAIRVGFTDGEYVINPESGDLKNSRLDLVVSGTKDSIMMVESEAKELTEEEMLKALDFAQENMKPVIALIEKLAKEAGKEKWKIEKKDNSDLEKRIKKLGEGDFKKAYKIKDKQERTTKISETRSNIIAKLKEELAENFNEQTTNSLVKHLEKDIVRGDLIAKKIRIDGRKVDEIRPIVAETQLLPQTHGSALFTRGETQAIVVATLGTSLDEQRIDSIEGDVTERFMLHYNFPPFSVGEVGRMTGPGRREIGHGKLAWRAINPLLPSKEVFPYTIRVVSEITESNGSSSMATVCGTSMALMDAGVPLEKAISGIAMGLVKEGKDYVVLSDILGDEDNLGDMDFKVAGTKDGITALQMDIKIQGISAKIMSDAISQAKEGRLHILKEMSKGIKETRESVAENAPKTTTIRINKAKIREVIGSGGKVIKGICEASGAKIDIDDDGTIRVSSSNGDQAKKAIEMIQNIVAEPEVGRVYNDAKIVKILDFGAIAEFSGKNQGLIHISQFSDARVEKVEDVVKEGDTVRVKIISVDKQGKIKLSMKDLD
ncbi:MAG: polyribonucleotide nucleotidyltransferase [Alphaproteobacteria bacterium]|jgi:polyribonucleotide nucleotidyltransferase